MTKGKNKFIEQRGRGFRYERAVPRDLAHLDSRAPKVREVINTTDLVEARRRRDILAAADDGFWAALRAGENAETARARYQAQVRLQGNLNMAEVEESDFRRMSLDARIALWENVNKASEVMSGKPHDDMSVDDIRSVSSRIFVDGQMHPVMAAAFSRLRRPAETLRAALDAHVERQNEGNARSENQKRKWRERRERAVARFEAVMGRDMDMVEITRDHALRYQRYWRDRIANENLTHDMAKKAFASLKAIYEDHFEQLGDTERRNPFAGIIFAPIQHKERQPIERRWIEERWLSDPAALAAMNVEARRILIVVAETGARPSEICNLVQSCICLDEEIPYVDIKPRPGRALKAKVSKRRIPLIGAALDAMRQHPQGFPKYLDKEDSLSTAINKFLRQNALLPGPGASVYGLRHGYIDRLRDTGVAEELRRAIVGHTGGGSHDGYGRGHQLVAMRDAMVGVASKYNPAAI